MLTTLGVVAFALGLLLSIALHEVGHLVPAKRSGVKVTQYMVGFGPTLWSTRRGETEYGLKWIPLGGYIRMIGMFPPRPGEPAGTARSSTTGPFQAMVEDARRVSLREIGPGDEARTFYRLPVRRKLLVMLGGPTMNFLIAVVLFSVALLSFSIPREATTTVAAVSECVVPASELAQRPDPNECLADDPRTPALQAGLRPGDQIVAFAGEPVTTWEQLSERIRATGAAAVTVTVLRSGWELELPVDLVATERENLEEPGELVTVGFLGVEPTRIERRATVEEVPGFVWDATWTTGQAVLAVPQRMVGVWNAAFSGDERDPNGPIGIVGVSRIGGEVASTTELDLSQKAFSFLALLAGLNLALFVFNLIPLLPLDGGHVAGALWEGARRQVARWRDRPDPGPVDVAKMLPLAYTVALLLVAMSGLLLYADLVNPVRLG